MTDIEEYREELIDKACEWLADNTMNELCLDLGNVYMVKEFIDNFREAMKG